MILSKIYRGLLYSKVSSPHGQRVTKHRPVASLWCEAAMNSGLCDGIQQRLPPNAQRSRRLHSVRKALRSKCGCPADLRSETELRSATDPNFRRWTASVWRNMKMKNSASLWHANLCAWRRNTSVNTFEAPHIRQLPPSAADQWSSGKHELRLCWRRIGHRTQKSAQLPETLRFSHDVSGTFVDKRWCSIISGKRQWPQGSCGYKSWRDWCCIGVHLQSTAGKVRPETPTKPSAVHPETSQWQASTRGSCSEKAESDFWWPLQGLSGWHPTELDHGWIALRLKIPQQLGATGRTSPAKASAKLGSDPTGHWRIVWSSQVWRQASKVPAGRSSGSEHRELWPHVTDSKPWGDI